MKHSFTSVLLLSILLHLPCIVLAAPFNWQGRHAWARTLNSTTVDEKSTTTTSVSKALETSLKDSSTTAFKNSTYTTTTSSKAKATATKTKNEESTASATIIRGSSPLQTALTPKITDWNSCQSFLSSSGINLFVNQIDLTFDVVVDKVTVLEILIDSKGRARETRVRHAFPQPTNYYPEFDSSKGKGGKGKGKSNSTTTSTVKATATAVTNTKEKAKATASTTTTTSTTAKASKSAAEESSSTTSAEGTKTSSETASETSSA